jgi:hypothetical protein
MAIIALQEKAFNDGDIDIPKVLIEWLDYKKERRQRYTKIGLKKLVAKTSEMIQKHG